MVPLGLDQPRSQGATAACGLGQDRTGGRKNIQTPYHDTAFGGGPALYPAPWLVRPPRWLSVSYEAPTIDPTLASLGCLQTFAQGVSLLPLVGDLQLAARTQGPTITSNLTPWARFP